MQFKNKNTDETKVIAMPRLAVLVIGPLYLLFSKLWLASALWLLVVIIMQVVFGLFDILYFAIVNLCFAIATPYFLTKKYTSDGWVLVEDGGFVQDTFRKCPGCGKKISAIANQCSYCKSAVEPIPTIEEYYSVHNVIKKTPLQGMSMGEHIDRVIMAHGVKKTANGYETDGEEFSSFDQLVDRINVKIQGRSNAAMSNKNSSLPEDSIQETAAEKVKYKVLLCGLSEAVEADTAKLNLSKLFKCSVQQLETLLKSSSFMVKAGVEANIANQYKLAIEKAGGVCSLVPEPQESAVQENLSSSVKASDVIQSKVVDSSYQPDKSMLQSMIGSKLTLPNKGVFVGAIVLLVFGVVGYFLLNGFSKPPSCADEISVRTVKEIVLEQIGKQTVQLIQYTGSDLAGVTAEELESLNSTKSIIAGKIKSLDFQITQIVTDGYDKDASKYNCRGKISTQLPDDLINLAKSGESGQLALIVAAAAGKGSELLNSPNENFVFSVQKTADGKDILVEVGGLKSFVDHVVGAVAAALEGAVSPIQKRIKEEKRLLEQQRSEEADQLRIEAEENRRREREAYEQTIKDERDKRDAQKKAELEAYQAERIRQSEELRKKLDQEAASRRGR